MLFKSQRTTLKSEFGIPHVAYDGYVLRCGWCNKRIWDFGHGGEQRKFCKPSHGDSFRKGRKYTGPVYR